MFWRAHEKYNPFNLQQLATEIDKRFNRTQSAERDIVVADRALILRSPNGTYYRVDVANDGTLSTTSLGTSL